MPSFTSMVMRQPVIHCIWLFLLQLFFMLSLTKNTKTPFPLTIPLHTNSNNTTLFTVLESILFIIIYHIAIYGQVYLRFTHGYMSDSILMQLFLDKLSCDYATFILLFFIYISFTVFSPSFLISYIYFQIFTEHFYMPVNLLDNELLQHFILVLGVCVCVRL